MSNTTNTSVIKTTKELLKLNQIASSVFLVFAFSIFTALAAHVKLYLPGTVVPITLQTAVVLSSGILLGAKRGALSQMLYLFLGLSGLPFFAVASFSVFGPTGGYVIGFVLAAYFAGKLVSLSRSYFRNLALLVLATLPIFALGAFQLKIFLNLDWQQTFILGVFPFVIGDVVKAVLALSFAQGIAKARQFFS